MNCEAATSPYALLKPNPLAGFRLSSEQCHVELARHYFRWIGPATLPEFQWFSGLGVKASQAAVAPLGLVACAKGDAKLMLPEDLDALEAFEPPDGPQIALVGSIDALFLHRRDLKGHIDPKDQQRKVFGDRAMVSLGGLADLPSHAIVDRGRLIGLWEYEPESARIVWTAWGEAHKDRAVGEAVARTEAFVRDQLGDARSFSLDSPKSRAPRIAALRKA